VGEWTYIITAPIAAAMFAIGGTGFKWIRRFVLPGFLLIMAIISGILASQYSILWKAAITCSILVGMFCIGYGDGLPKNPILRWLIRAAILAFYFVPMLIMGFTWWIVICPIVLWVYFFLSNLKGTAQTFIWKGWELLAGGAVGFTFADIIARL